MNNITYHKATQNDVATLVDNRIAFALELSGEQDPEVIVALKKQMTGYFSKATTENTCISFIAKCDGEVAGIGSVHVREQPGNIKNPTGKWGYIMNMYTLPAFRRKGICKGLLDALIEDAGKSGITAFELHATNEGELVYRQSNFELHNEPTYRKYIR
ncbi:MAG TPA: GNAT family N-acetyltransferase [Bacteroidia bacterium]|nr:GNAT family N-acetyltransferase [Bacteroidia bacterium]